nr:phage tail tape measure protein [Lachnospiraceae bacterium]
VFGKVGDRATAIGNKLMPVTAGITALSGAGIAAAMELDDGYDTIITKTGAAGEALEGLNEVAENLFTNMPIEMEDAGTAVGEINTRFGETGERLEELSKQFIEFANINGTDLNNSIGKVDKIMEQYNIDASETANVLGLLTQKGQATGISVDTLMDSLQKNGPVFKEMGLNMVQATDLLAQFEANGVNADMAIAGLRKSIKAYTDEGKSVDEALALTIDSIKNAETETEALSIAQEVFGTKGAAEMATAIREGRLDLESLSASMEEYGNVVEDTFNATQDPWDEAKVAANNLKLAAADLGTTILSSLQPTITKVVTKIKEFTQWFRNLSDSQKETIIKVAALVAAIGPALVIFGKLSTGISNVIGGVTKLKGAMGAGGGLAKVLTMLTGPVGIVIAIIAALAAGFVALYKTNDKFREKVDNVMAKVKKAFSDMWVQIKPILQQVNEAFLKLLNALQPVFEFILTYIGSIVNGIISAAAPIVSAIKNVIDFVTNIVQAFTALLRGDFSGFFSHIKAALQNAIDYVKNITQAWVNFIVGFFEGFGLDIKEIFSDIWNGIVSIFQGCGQWFKDRFTEAYTNVTGVFAAIGSWFGARWTEIKTALAAIPQWFGTQFQNAWTNIKNAFANVTSFFSDLWTKIKNCFTDVGVKIGSAVGDAFKSTINSCLSTIEGVVNKFIGMINGVIGIVNKIPGVSLGQISTLSLPRLAKGGVLKEGTAMVAEAGPELLSMVNGKAVVTPLTGTARNRAMDNAGGSVFNQNVNITSPTPLTPYEVGRQTRIQTRSLVRRLNPRRV